MAKSQSKAYRRVSSHLELLRGSKDITISHGVKGGEEDEFSISRRQIREKVFLDRESSWNFFLEIKQSD